MACLPLKINVGNFLESIELGADTIIITGGCGPCRFGYYAEMHRQMLKEMGLDIEIITLEVDETGFSGLIKKLKYVFPKKSLVTILNAARKAFSVMKEVDNLDALCYKVRPRELKKGKTDEIMKKFEREILTQIGEKAILKCIKQTQKDIKNIDIDEKFEPMKIGIVGEIYTLIEPLTNVNIERVLGNMGVEVSRSLTISHWITQHILKAGFKVKKRDYEKAAYPYIKTMIGGHAQETVGHTVIYSKKDFDGVIQIYPLTCMPEVVAESILPTISKDFDIPVCTLVMDEITGEAGYITRIDAFVDMLQRKKTQKEKKDELILSGN
jgi:predicted nucleotide-binding protein (sugar kinase/HSP70/actin superfamily)